MQYSGRAETIVLPSEDDDSLDRVFAVITFAMMAVGRSMAMIPDYSKGKMAALRIMRLHKRRSEINPNDDSGIILVYILSPRLSLASDECRLERRRG